MEKFGFRFWFWFGFSLLSQTLSILLLILSSYRKSLAFLFYFCLYFNLYFYFCDERSNISRLASLPHLPPILTTISNRMLMKIAVSNIISCSSFVICPFQSNFTRLPASSHLLSLLLLLLDSRPG